MRFFHLHFLFLLCATGLAGGGLVAQEQSDEPALIVKPVEDGASLSTDEVYEEAIKDFTKGSYDNAEAKFLTLVKRGLISKELYFNLGTTLEKKDQAGKSALWMRRALLLAPDMVEPRQNLRFLKKKLGYLEFADEGTAAILRDLPPTLGDWIAMIGLWLVAICLAMAFLLPRYQDRRFRPLLFACLAAILAFGGAWFSQHYARNYAIENFATVTARGVTALTSPVPDAKAVIDLPPGSEVRILQETGPWTYVEIPGEIRGWLRNEQLAAVWPITFR
ncbi:hypothetical protein VSU19_19220 [Verrucomicrobiales bacterium BCK34]|nr:hypothetical protein [Verrucomicrobiales bacterium BCK34]